MTPWLPDDTCTGEADVAPTSLEDLDPNQTPLLKPIASRLCEREARRTMTEDGAQPVARDLPPAPPSPIHLVVLQHGLWGNASNLLFVESLVKLHTASFSPGSGSPLPVRTLNSTVNNDKLTYDGIHVCGERLVALIKDTVQALQEQEGLQVVQCSFIGYSLGGLIARYAVGKLQHEQAFDAQHQGGGFEPMSFVTIATPHLGAWRFPTESASWMRKAYNKVYHKMVPVIASMTGHQLMLEDTQVYDQPLLMNMSDPTLPFIQGLRQFKRLILLANTHHDQMVPYRAAAICPTDPYEGKQTVPAHDPVKYPSVVKPCDHAVEPKAVRGRWVVYVFLGLLPLLFPVLLVVLAVMSWQGSQHYRGLLRQGPGTAQQAWISQPAGDTSGSEPGLDLEQGSESGSTGGCESVLLGDKQAPDARSMSIQHKQEWIVENMNRLPWTRVDVDAGHGHAHAAIVLRNPERFTEKDHLHYLLSHMHWG